MSYRDESTQSTLSDPDDFERRLNAKLEARRIKEEKLKNAQRSGWAVGIRYGTDFVSGVVVGTVLGYGVDWLLGSLPWGLIVGMILGFAAGTLNVVRSASEINKSAEGTSPGDTDT